MNDGSAVNEWKCSSCGVHIGDDMALVRVSYAIDRAGMRNLLRDPDLLIGDEYCSPQCAITGSITMLYRLKQEDLVVETFGTEANGKRYSDTDPDLYAYMGEDELGTGEVGIKSGLVPAGLIPLVAVDRDLHKIEGGEVAAGMRWQAGHHGKEIRLVHYVPVEVVRAFGG